MANESQRAAALEMLYVVKDTVVGATAGCIGFVSEKISAITSRGRGYRPAMEGADDLSYFQPLGDSGNGSSDRGPFSL